MDSRRTNLARLRPRRLDEQEGCYSFHGRFAPEQQHLLLGAQKILHGHVEEPPFHAFEIPDGMVQTPPLHAARSTRFERLGAEGIAVRCGEAEKAAWVCEAYDLAPPVRQLLVELGG